MTTEQIAASVLPLARDTGGTWSPQMQASLCLLVHEAVNDALERAAVMIETEQSDDCSPEGCAEAIRALKEPTP